MIMTDVEALAEFLDQRSHDPETTPHQRAVVQGLLGSYRHGQNPVEVEATMRFIGRSYQNHPDYLQEWNES